MKRFVLLEIDTGTGPSTISLFSTPFIPRNLVLWPALLTDKAVAEQIVRSFGVILLKAKLSSMPEIFEGFTAINSISWNF
jgi:hypothetical protein